MPGMKITYVSHLIAECWDAAELAVREEIKRKRPDKNEEIITDMFSDELRLALEEAATKGRVEYAFQKDLERAFPRIISSDLRRISNGLIATVNFHSRSVESRTGGDFGLVLVRPDVTQARFDGSALNIEHDCQRGLLCQAKVLRTSTKQGGAKWGPLTANQKRVLAGRMEYFGLVLYRYLDEHRRQLAEFQWQLAAGNSIEVVTAWLKTGKFPELHRSAEILESLAEEQIGTDDKSVIAEVIAPPTRRSSLAIHVRWRDGYGPGTVVHTHVKSQVRQQVMIRN